MRIAIYCQVAINILVILFRHRSQLTKPFFRIGIVQSLSFTIAFEIGLEQQAYSTQEQWAAILTVASTMASTTGMGIAIWLMVVDKEKMNLVDKTVAIVYVPGTFGLLLAAIFKKSTWIMVRCTRLQYSVEGTLTVSALSYTTLSLVFLTYLLSIVAILHVRRSKHQNQKRTRCYIWIIGVCGLLTLMLTIGAVEYIMGTAFYVENDGISIPLTASTWGLGQVMTVITTVSYIWEIASLYAEGGQMGRNKSRLHHRPQEEEGGSIQLNDIVTGTKPSINEFGDR